MFPVRFFLAILTAFIILTFPLNVFAAGKGDSCTYPQTGTDEQVELCKGTYQTADNQCLACKYTDGVDPDCKKPSETNRTLSSSVCSDDPPPSYSTPSTTNPTPSPSQTNNSVAQNYKAPQHTDYTFANIGHSIVCFIADPKEGFPTNQKCLGLDRNGQLTFNNNHTGGALGFVNNTMLAMYNNPPTSTTYYLADLGSNLGLIKPVYAQNVGGSGEAVIKPVYELWQMMRNVSYLIFTLVFVVVGFMIMFRSKINPQTVISLQQALPGLVLGLILVTFSYFIASFIVDLSFVGMQLVAYLFQNTGLASVDKAAEVASNSNIFNLFWSFTGGILGATFTTLVQLLTPPREFTQALLAKGPITPTLGVISFFIPGIADLISTGIGFSVGGIAGVLVSAIILIALLIQMFRLLWGLVSAYISILVFSIIGPLIILASSVPGKSGILSLWWKTLLANVLIFPAVFAAFLFSAIILGDTGGFTSTLPLFAGLPVDVLKLIIGLGIILGTPAIPKMVKDAMGVKDIAGIPQAALAGAMAGGTLGGMAVTGGYDRLWKGGKEGSLTSPKGPIGQWAADRLFRRRTS